MSLGSLIGGGESTDALKNWQSPFVTKDSLNSSLSALDNPTKSLAGFSGGGITGGYDANGNATVSVDPSRSALVSDLSNVYGDQVAKLGDLLTKIAPGYSDLRTAQLADLQNQQTSAISNLRQNLENRRVLGSSFAQDSLTRANSQFAHDRSQITSDTYLKELAATNDLINQQHTAGVNQVQAKLTESNLEAGIAGQLGQQATSAMSAATQLKAQLLASLAGGAQTQMGANLRQAATMDEAANSSAGNFFGQLIGQIPAAAAMAA